MNRIIALVMTLCGVLPTLGGLHKAAFSVRVIDEAGLPVSNAVIDGGFYGEAYKVVDDFNVLTDTNGMAHFKGQTARSGWNYGHVRWWVKKDGYYRILGMECSFTNVSLGRLLPWDHLYEVELRKIINPIPLYARSLVNSRPPVKLPELAEPVGFDLVKADWIGPWGTGEVADFIIQIDVSPAVMREGYYEEFPNAIRNMNMDFTLTFSNPDDGIQSYLDPPRSGSDLRLPRYAPENGYKTNLVSHYWVTPERRNDMDNENQNYFFRVRSSRDENGNLVSALYGKMHGRIHYTHKGEIEFTYYLNPTPNDRNLEFSRELNLFKNLKASEQVSDP